MHARLITINTPKNHQIFLEELTKRQYPVEGQLRKGYARAHIAEIKAWDLRAKKEIIPQILTDLGTIDLGNQESMGGGDGYAGRENIAHHIPTPIRLLVSTFVKLIRKISNHFVPTYHTQEMVDKHKRIPAVGWQYTFVVGCYADPEKEVGIEEI